MGIIVFDGIQGIDLPGVNSAYLKGTLTFGVAQEAATATNVDFADIPNWVKKVSVILSNISLNGADSILVQVGTSSGIIDSGYISTGSAISDTSTAASNATTGFIMRNTIASARYCAIMNIVNISGTTWVSSHTGIREPGSAVVGGGAVTLDSALTQVRIRGNGTNIFDFGSINIAYE